MIDFCSQGIRKCVPSLTTVSLTPDRRSKMTARLPPLTSYMEAWIKEPPMKAGITHLAIELPILFAILTSQMVSFPVAVGW